MEYTQGNAGLALGKITVSEPAQKTKQNNNEIGNLSSGAFFLLSGLPVIISFLSQREHPLGGLQRSSMCQAA